MKMGGLVCKEYELSCISPLHIGSGEKLSAFEYLYDRKGETVYFLDESKWICFSNSGRRAAGIFGNGCSGRACRKESCVLFPSARRRR